MTVDPPIRVTGRALEALRREGLDPARTFLQVRYVLGCGGAGYQLRFADRALEDGHQYPVDGGLTISLDDYAARRLSGGAIDYDEEKETEGFWLDHPDAAFAAFC